MNARIVSLCAIVALCLPGARSAPAAVDGDAAERVRIVIVHTTDLHGNILPTRDYDGRDGQGGLARCATEIGRIRAENPHVVLLDIGDTFQGTPVSYLSRGEVMVRIMNRLRYDAWVWGNHEFDWGWRAVISLGLASEAPLLNANLRLDGSEWPAEIRRKILPYMVLDIGGLRVAVIGLNTPGIPYWSRPRLLGGARIEDSIAALEHVLPRVHGERPDVIVLAVHQGFRSYGDGIAGQIRAIADRFPELDLILGGHTHADQPEVVLNGVYYSQAAYWGTRLGVAEVVYDTGLQRVVSIDCTTLPMDGSVPTDPAVVELVRSDLDRARAYEDEIVGIAAERLGVDGWPDGPCPIFSLLASAVAEASGASIVVHGLLDPEQEIAAGPIRMGDLWRIVPYENTLGVLDVSGAQLREILEEQARWIDSPRFNAPWGVDCVFATGEEGPRVRSLRLADKTPVAPDGRYRVATHSYALAGAGERFPRLRALGFDPSTSCREDDRLTRDILADYVRRLGTVTAPAARGSWEMAGAPAAAAP